MSKCRSQLIAEGKPYPKSSCAVHGSVFNKACPPPESFKRPPQLHFYTSDPSDELVDPEVAGDIMSKMQQAAEAVTKQQHRADLMKVRLENAEGGVVGTASIPPFVTVPAVLVLGSRTFVHVGSVSQETLPAQPLEVYREAFGYFVPNLDYVHPGVKRGF